MARQDSVGIRLLTRNGHDWATRYPLIVEAVNHLQVRSVLIDGDVVCCDEATLASILRKSRPGFRLNEHLELFAFRQQFSALDPRIWGVSSPSLV